MARRSKSYVSETAEKLREPAYAEAYLNSSIKNFETPFKVALADMIDKYGHAEFAKKVDVASPNMTRYVQRLRANENITLGTIELIMKGFGLSLKLSATRLEDA